MLNRAQYPSDVIALVVLWRLRYKLSLRDLPEMFAVHGMVFSHEAVRDWEARLTPALAEELRRKRRGKAGRSWYVDEMGYPGLGGTCSDMGIWRRPGWGAGGEAPALPQLGRTTPCSTVDWTYR